MYPRYLRVPRAVELTNSHRHLQLNPPPRRHNHSEMKMIRVVIKEAGVDLVGMYADAHALWPDGMASKT